MSIDPVYWLTIANERSPQIGSVTEWIPGHVAPVRVGAYERFFTDGNIEQWWDGESWRSLHKSGRLGPKHWRQLGDYPSWRGLSAPPQGDKT